MDLSKVVLFISCFFLYSWSNTVRVYQGQKFNISCCENIEETVSSCSLYFRGVKIREKPRQLAYSLYNVEKIDIGLYKCKAVINNTSTVEDKSVMLEVMEIPSTVAHAFPRIVYNNHSTNTAISNEPFKYEIIDEKHKIFANQPRLRFRGNSHRNGETYEYKIKDEENNVILTKKVTLVDYSPSGSVKLKWISLLPNGFEMEWEPPEGLIPDSITAHIQCKSTSRPIAKKLDVFNRIERIEIPQLARQISCTITCDDSFGRSYKLDISPENFQVKYIVKIEKLNFNYIKLNINYVQNSNYFISQKIPKDGLYVTAKIDDKIVEMKTIFLIDKPVIIELNQQIKKGSFLELVVSGRSDYLPEGMTTYYLGDHVVKPPLFPIVLSTKESAVKFEFTSYLSIHEEKHNIIVYVSDMKGLHGSVQIILANTIKYNGSKATFDIDDLNADTEYAVKFRFVSIDGKYYSAQTYPIYFKTNLLSPPRPISAKLVENGGFYKLTWKTDRFISYRNPSFIIRFSNGDVNIRVVVENRNSFTIKNEFLDKRNLSVTIETLTYYGFSDKMEFETSYMKGFDFGNLIEIMAVIIASIFLMKLIIICFKGLIGECRNIFASG